MQQDQRLHEHKLSGALADFLDRRGTPPHLPGARSLPGAARGPTPIQEIRAGLRNLVFMPLFRLGPPRIQPQSSSSSVSLATFSARVPALRRPHAAGAASARVREPCPPPTPAAADVGAVRRRVLVVGSLYPLPLARPLHQQATKWTRPLTFSKRKTGSAIETSSPPVRGPRSATPGRPGQGSRTRNNGITTASAVVTTTARLPRNGG